MANETPITDERLKFLSRLLNSAREQDRKRLITAAFSTIAETAETKVLLTIH